MSSRLSKAQRRTLMIVLGLGLFMLADTLYLLVNRLAAAVGLDWFAVSDLPLPRFYQVLVLSHTGVGLTLVLLATGFVAWHLPAVWRWHRRRAIATGAVALALGLVLAVTGLLIVSAASNRDNPWAYWGHVAAAAVVPLAYLAHRRSSLWKPSRRSHLGVPATVTGLLLLAVLLHGLSYDREEDHRTTGRTAVGTPAGPGAGQRQVAEYAPPGFVPANYVPVTSPFFPAATTTTTGGYLPSRIITRDDLPADELLARDLREHGFAVKAQIGSETCARCHAGIVEQWSKSAHRFASFNNPFYEATIVHLREHSRNTNPELEAHLAAFPELAGREAKVKSKWCSGCHDPALMLAGRMSGEIDRTWPQSQAGLTCLACHAIDRVLDLRVTEIAASTAVLRVGGEPSASVPAAAQDWMRLNDWGIGLLLQEDTRAAALAFGRAAEVAPDKVDGTRNLARVALADGDLTTAYAHLQRAELLAPGDPRTAWIWGLVLQENGRYAEAALAYRRVLELFPEDRSAWRNLGRILYLDGRLEAALAALDRVLAIDPEDRTAHYHRMLVLRALSREEEAGLAEAAYQYYQIDESAAEVTRQYRLTHPADNRESLALHVHDLIPGPGDGR